MSKLKTELTFSELSNFMGNKYIRPIGNNTICRKDNGMMIVELHGSAIIKIEAESITLDSCGYMTTTTKERMNQALRQY
jgi:hypothetical protein